MFFQLCLVTAGLHFGRKIWANWHEQQNQRNDGEAPAPPLTDDAELAISESSGVVHNEDAGVEDQLKTAAIATGLTAASHFLPQLWFVGGVSAMYSSVPLFSKAKHLILDEGRLGIEVLDTIGLLTSLAARQYTLSASMMLCCVSAQKLRIETKTQARQSMQKVFRPETTEVWVLQDGIETNVSSASLRAGDVVVVGAGASIPGDGLVMDGAARVDQHILTGETQPVEKRAGDRVFAMARVLSGWLHVQVESTGNATTAEQISAALQRTADHTSTLEQEGQAVADASALPLLALGACAFPLAGPEGTAAMLSVGIADTLQVLGPLSMLNSLRNAYNTGILLKDGRVLQLLPRVDTVVFDLTGAFIQEPSQVSQVIRALQDRRLSICLLSEVDEASTSAVAKLLGLDDYLAGVLPADKAQIIKTLQSQGHTVCFVGNGLSDSLACAQATVSVSMSGVANVAKDSAQVMIMDRDLAKLPVLFDITSGFQRNQRGLLLSAAIPAALAVGCVFFAGHTINSVAVFIASLSSGLAVATWPHHQKSLPGTVPGEASKEREESMLMFQGRPQPEVQR